MADNPASSRQYHIPVLFTVDAASEELARQEVFSQLKDQLRLPAGVPEVGVARVRSWVEDQAMLPRQWAPFIGTPVPDIVVEMFPPEPRADTFRHEDGGLDVDTYEDAAERWREACLSLAMQAARLPDLLERVGAGRAVPRRHPRRRRTTPAAG